MAPEARGLEKFFEKNTSDLQWKMRAKYNARLCAALRKFAGARTMENNEKNKRGAIWLDMRSRRG
jgi:hypothetical protein